MRAGGALGTSALARLTQRVETNVDSVTITDYIDNRLKRQMKYHSDTAKKSQATYRRLQAAAIVLGALTPLLLAFNLLLVPPARQVSQYVFTLLPIVASVTATVVQSFLATYRYKDLWLESRTTKEALDQELYLYEHGTGPYASQSDPDALLVERAESVISGERESWTSIVRTRAEGDPG